MIGTKELCTLLLGGAIGVTSTVGVQKKVSPRPKVVAAKGGGNVGKSRPAQRLVARPAESPAPRILDCPTGSPFSAEPNQFALPGTMPPGFGGDMPVATAPGVWGGGRHAPVAPPPPTIPAPPTWTMMVSGFGLVGLSLRRRKAAA